MKWVSGTINLSKVTRTVRDVGIAGRVFVSVSAFTFLFFMLMGLTGVIQDKLPQSSMPAMKGVAVALSSHFFVDMLAMEVPHLKGEETESALSQKNVMTFLVEYLTGVNPNDPRSLLAGTVPGLKGDSATVLFSSKTASSVHMPFDSTPPSEVFQETAETSTLPKEQTGAGTQEPAANPVSEPAKPASLSTGGKKVVFIYHSHNRESFLPELKNVKSPDLAYHSDVNITKVGKRLAEKLEDLGIGAQHSETDYPSTVKSFEFAKSYAYSNKTVKEALATNKDIKMVFDIHRDSLDRDRTTATIDGKDYAQIFFVVGKRNPDWEENSEFAGKLHAKLEKGFPGISKGVFGKSSHGNAEYNQSLFSSSVLIEIGGPYNTMEEMNRTADLLASVVADMYWDAEKVSVPVQGQ
jgi:stage II sporulation protein P